jgi:trafficking protein particle complex subunit 5
MFAEIVAHANRNSKGDHLETRLHRLGLNVGERALALFHLRERQFRREPTVLGMLQFIASYVWKSLFQKPAQVLATDNPEEFYVVDRNMILNKYMSVSTEAARENSMINCTNFAAGIIEGMMHSAGFPNTKVDAAYTHSGSLDVVNDPTNITFIVHVNKPKS